MTKTLKSGTETGKNREIIPIRAIPCRRRGFTGHGLDV